MASLGNALVNKILGHSAAEKAFRPWWDNLEDYLIYGLVMLGLVVAPTAIINSTPLDCNRCQNDAQCPDEKFRQEDRGVEEVTGVVGKDLNLWWVKKYCTMTAVDGFMMYFPYILLIMAMVIVLIERVFVRIFKAGLKLDMFYNLLVKETLEEDEESSAQTATGGGGGDAVDGPAAAAAAVDLENSKTAIEVSQSFSESSNYFLSYLFRTVVELCLAATLLTWLLLLGLPSIQNDEFIYCMVHGFKYECAGHPQQFYMYVLFITLVLLAIYLLCCIYNLLWLAFPQLGALSRVMTKYRKVARHNAKEIVSDEILLGDLHSIYYKNRDLKLLLDLLAESSGVAHSIRIMSLFDKKFRASAEARNLKVQRVGEVNDAVEVEFEDAPTLTDIFAHIQQVACIYTVEIRPATSQSSCVAFKFQCGPAGAKGNADGNTKNVVVNAEGDTELEPLEATDAPPKKKTQFRALDPKKKYTIRVCTVVNGRAIAKRTEVVNPATE